MDDDSPSGDSTGETSWVSEAKISSNRRSGVDRISYPAATISSQRVTQLPLGHQLRSKHSVRIRSHTKWLCEKRTGCPSLSWMVANRRKQVKVKRSRVVFP